MEKYLRVPADEDSQVPLGVKELQNNIMFLKHHGMHYEANRFFFKAAMNFNYDDSLNTTAFFFHLAQAETALAEQLFHKRISTSKKLEKTNIDQCEFSLLVVQFKIAEASNACRKYSLNLFELYKRSPEIVLLFFDHSNEEMLLTRFIENFVEEDIHEELFSKFIKWICQSDNFYQHAVSLLELLPGNMNSKYYESNIVGSVVPCELITFKRFDLYKRMEKLFTNIEETNKVVLKYKYKLITDGFSEADCGGVKVTTNAKRIVDMTCIVYGKIYTALFSELCLNSILLSDDFLKLCEKYNVQFNIFTDSESKTSVENACLPLKKFNVSLNLDTTFLKDNPSDFRVKVNLEAIFRMVKNDGIYFMLSPDIIYGNGFFNAVESCPEGGGVLSGHVRVAENRMLESMRNGMISRILKNKNRNRLLSEYAFSDWAHYYQRLWIENLSPMTLSYFGDSSIFISVHGPAWILKPDRHLMAEWIANSRLRYSNSLMDHLYNPSTTKFWASFIKRKNLR